MKEIKRLWSATIFKMHKVLTNFVLLFSNVVFVHGDAKIADFICPFWLCRLILWPEKIISLSLSLRLGLCMRCNQTHKGKIPA